MSGQAGDGPEPVRLIDVMRTLLWSVYAPSLFASIALNGITVLLPLYVLKTTGSAGYAATVVGIFGLGQMLVGIPAGVAVSRFGDKRVALTAIACLMLCVLAFAFSRSHFSLAALAFAFGASTGAWQIARLNYMTEATTVENRGRSVSIMAGLQRIGWLVGPAGGGLIADSMGFRTMFLCAAVAYFVAMIFLWLFARRDPGRTGQGSASVRVFNVAREHRGIFLRAGPAIIGLKILRASRTLILPLWGAHIGLSAAEIGLVFGLASTIDLFMFYPAGVMIDRFGRRSVLIPAIVLLSVAPGALYFANDFAGFALLSLIGGLGNGFSTGINMTLGGDFSPRERRGEFLGLWRFVGEVGTGVGPFMISGLIAAGSIASAGVAVAGLGVVAMGFVVFLLPEPLEKSR